MGFLSSFVGTVSDRTALNSARRHLPMINEVVNLYSTFLKGTSQLSRKKRMMRWYKDIPEATALVNKVARDIVYKYHFEPVHPGESGRNKVMNANRFAMETRYTNTLFSEAVDEVVTGESFGWMGKIKDSQVLEVVQKEVDNQLQYIEFKEKDLLSQRIKREVFLELKAEEGFANLKGIDEDLLRPRKYRYIASSTVEITFDQLDIRKYIQKVGGEETIFDPKEIIHYTHTDVDGKVNGFTPLDSAVVQLECLRQLWQNLLSLHKNGGSPDKVFALENVNPNTPSYKRIEEQLEKYKLAENKHGNMLFTGKLSIHELQQLDKMPFMDSGLYITGVMAMLWEVPKSSIPFIVGSANTSNDTGGNSEKGYWRTIEFHQKRKAETASSQLWIPHFGVKLVFDNPHIHQEVELQTSLQLKYGNVKSMDEILFAADKQLKLEKRLRLLGISDGDIETAKVMDPGIAIGGAQGDQLSQGQVKDSDDKKNIKTQKKVEQAQSSKSGSANPSGV